MGRGLFAGVRSRQGRNGAQTLPLEESSVNAELNFVRQQGFRDAGPAACAHQYPALMWQPRAIGVLVLVGLVLQAWVYFAALAALLWWNTLWPRANALDALYNRFVARPQGRPELVPAPGPRRFAQGMAGTFLAAIAGFLLLEWRPLAWAVEGVLVAALGALIFGRFCLGSYLFLVLTGHADFAKRTLPWARSE
jgi:hypothetical protein